MQCGQGGHFCQVDKGGLAGQVYEGVQASNFNIFRSFLSKSLHVTNDKTPL